MAYNDINTGRKSSVGTSEVQLMSDDLVAENGVLIYADSSNAATVYIGSSGLTTDSADSTDGFPLEAGDSITIPVKHPNKIYIKAASGSTNKVWWILV